MTVLLERQAVVLAKVEATPGTAETLSATDAPILVYGPKFKPDQARYKRQPARASKTPLAAIPGRSLGRITFQSEVKGGGGAAVVPEWDVYAKACGLTRNSVSTAAIGAIVGGPYVGGETVTFAPSGATGRVVGDHTTGVAALRYVVLTGAALIGDVATGGTSGATSTLSAGPTAAQGFEYVPSSADPSTITLGLYNDGVRHLLAGVMGTAKIVHKVGEPPMWEWEFLGVWISTTDTALPAPTLQEITPAAWQGASVKCGTFAAIVESLSVDLGVSLVPRPSASAANGVLAIHNPTRDVTAELDPEMSLVAEHDWFGRMRNGTTGHLSYEFGTGTGKRITFAAPRVQYADVDPQARVQGIVTLRVPLEMVSATISGGDDEIQVGIY